MTDFAISLKLLLKMKSSLNTDRKILCSILPNLFLSHHVHSQRAPTIWDELGDLHIFNIYTLVLCICSILLVVSPDAHCTVSPFLFNLTLSFLLNSQPYFSFLYFYRVGYAFIYVYTY